MDVDGRTASITLSEKQNIAAGVRAAHNGARPRDIAGPCPFLRIPPFPGALIGAFSRTELSSSDDCNLVELVRTLKVGGTYWAAQPLLPASYELVRTPEALPSLRESNVERVLWTRDTPDKGQWACVVMNQDCDPWHMLASASRLVTTADDQLCIIASILGVPVDVYEEATGRLAPLTADVGRLLDDALQGGYLNPFSGAAMSARQAAELCGFWRQLIDSNRDIVGALGFASWKQDHVGPLLWGGSDRVQFLRAIDEAKPGARIGVWRSKASPSALAALGEAEIAIVEVEDGFLRSSGLGADCVPPLSITVDRLGAYFDPASPSELELLLQHGEFDAELLTRARKMREAIVEAGLSKYTRGAEVLERPGGTRRHILVPGQVEDDRAVQSGGCGLVSNLDLLAKVRAHAPDAYILYKPHPDVSAGHRRGAVAERECLKQADRIVTEAPIASLITMADEIHVNTSLAGFEALLRHKAVTTYGVPFYAGWGLTHDLGPVPARRTAKRTVDELVAASLLLYPRYIDPVTRLPCPAEVVVDRLTKQATGGSSLLVRVRRLQGKLMRRFRSMVQ